MSIFIDFDDVIFNTRSFKKDLSKIFSSCGISRSVFQETYDAMKARQEQYSIAAHVRLLKQQGELRNLSLCTVALGRFMRNLKRYVFLDAQSFLRHHQKQGLFLVSFGDAAFQRRKIAHSGVKKYFKRVVVTQGDKAKEVAALLLKSKAKKPYGIIFIDDSKKHIREVRSITSAIIIQILRKGRRTADEKSSFADHHVATLAGASKIIASL